MAAALVHHEVGMKAVGRVTTVGDDAMSKLQYYLGCMHSLLPGLNIPCALRNYQKTPTTISADEAGAVIALAAMLSPDVLLNNVLFVVPSGHQMLKNKSNEFYELSMATTFAAVADRVVIGGRQVKVAKIMLCTQNWLSSYWATPMQKILQGMKNGASASGPASAPPARRPALQQRPAPPAQRRGKSCTIM
jgi:hypothetical protein